LPASFFEEPVCSFHYSDNFYRAGFRHFLIDSQFVVGNCGLPNTALFDTIHKRALAIGTGQPPAQGPHLKAYIAANAPAAVV
jgi:hypothetical protein